MNRAWAFAVLALISGCRSGAGPAAPEGGDTATLQFTGSEPPPGSVVRVEECGGYCATTLALRFVGTSPGAEPATVSIELLDEDGQVCATALVTRTTEAGQATTFEAAQLRLGDETTGTWHCQPPARIARLRAEMVGVGGVRLAALDVPVTYTFELPPPAAQATAPRVTDLCWDIPGPSGGCGGDAPLPGEAASVGCEVEDADGDALTVTLRAESAHGGFHADGTLAPSVSRHFGPWPFPRRAGANFLSEVPTVAIITCEVVDARGLRATAEVCLPVVGGGGCP